MDVLLSVDDRLRREVGLTRSAPARLASGSPGLLASPLPVLQLAAVAVGAVEDAIDRFCSTVGLPAPGTPLDLERITAAYQSDRLLRISGSPVSAFAPFSGFFAAQDGWVRTHANYPHHRARLAALLGIDQHAERSELAAAIATRSGLELEAEAASLGALLVAVRDDAHWSATGQSAALALEPLIRRRSGAAGPPVGDRLRPTTVRPLAGLRVLDLTRVIAGPVATRTLALLGAEVLRIDPPQMPEIAWQHQDTGQGKRAALLDGKASHGRSILKALADQADVLVTGYRPGAIDALGFSPREGLITASVDAWGGSGPWSRRRGFDSLVQAATGIAMLEATGDPPGALPAQALDHSAGYLLAAAIIDDLCEVLDGRAPGNSAVSLARVGAALTGMPRSASSAVAQVPSPRCLVTHGDVTSARPALAAYNDYPFPARASGIDVAAWLPSS